jgi:hypothetical protein
MIRATDASGLVVITETCPITGALLSIPASAFPAGARTRTGAALRVEAWDRRRAHPAC